MITALAWRNIWRQPIRTALSLVGMAFASMLLVFMLSFQFGSYDTIKANLLRIVDGFGQFQPKGYKDNPEISKVIPNAAALMADLKAIPAVTAETKRTRAFVLLANGERTFAAAVTGVDPASENKISKLGTMIKQGRALKKGDHTAIILGDGLARNLRLKVGDKVVLLGSAMDGSVAADALKLVGIFKSGIPRIDRQMAEMPLSRFQSTFQMGKAVNTIAIVGNQLSDIVGIGGQLHALAAKYGVTYLNWGQLQPQIKQAIQLDISISVLMYLTLVVVVVFIILNTLYMSVLERTREFGVLLALGMKPGQVGRMVWMEMIFLSFVGNGAGIILGIALTAFFAHHGITFQGMDQIYAQWGLPSRLYPVMTPLRVLIGPGAIVVSIALLGIIPYRRVFGLKPVSAMAGE